MIFRFNVLICAVILWCYQSNVPISTIDRSLLCIVLFWFISIYTCINEFEFFWYTFSPATVMRKGLQFPYLMKMNCFNLVHAFFQVWFSVQHVFCCNVTDLHIQKVHAIISYFNIHCGWQRYQTAPNTHTRISV